MTSFLGCTISITLNLLFLFTEHFTERCCVLQRATPLAKSHRRPPQFKTISDTFSRVRNHPRVFSSNFPNQPITNVRLYKKFKPGSSEVYMGRLYIDLFSPVFTSLPFDFRYMSPRNNQVFVRLGSIGDRESTGTSGSYATIASLNGGVNKPPPSPYATGHADVNFHSASSQVCRFTMRIIPSRKRTVPICHTRQSGHLTLIVFCYEENGYLFHPKIRECLARNHIETLRLRTRTALI